MRYRAILLAFAPLYALAGSPSGDPPSGDPVRGEEIYMQCGACHSLTYDRTGPRHCGLLGRRAGIVPNFEYSDAMRTAKIVWIRETLDAFLASPTTFIPGTTMGYAGISNPTDRADLISYLEAVTSDPTRCRVFKRLSSFDAGAGVKS